MLKEKRQERSFDWLRSLQDDKWMSGAALKKRFRSLF